MGRTETFDVHSRTSGNLPHKLLPFLRGSLTFYRTLGTKLQGRLMSQVPKAQDAVITRAYFGLWSNSMDRGSWEGYSPWGHKKSGYREVHVHLLNEVLPLCTHAQCTWTSLHPEVAEGSSPVFQANMWKEEQLELVNPMRKDNAN